MSEEIEDFYDEEEDPNYGKDHVAEPTMSGQISDAVTDKLFKGSNDEGGRLRRGEIQEPNVGEGVSDGSDGKEGLFKNSKTPNESGAAMAAPKEDGGSGLFKKQPKKDNQEAGGGTESKRRGLDKGSNKGDAFNSSNPKDAALKPQTSGSGKAHPNSFKNPNAPTGAGVAGKVGGGVGGAGSPVGKAAGYAGDVKDLANAAKNKDVGAAGEAVTRAAATGAADFISGGAGGGELARKVLDTQIGKAVTKVVGSGVGNGAKYGLMFAGVGVLMVSVLAFQLISSVIMSITSTSTVIVSAVSGGGGGAVEICNQEREAGGGGDPVAGTPINLSEPGVRSNIKYVYDELKKIGYNDIAIAGVLGNMQQESQFNPTAGNWLGCYGIFQWCGDRKITLQSWSTSNGYDANTIKAQLAYFLHEMSTWRVQNARAQGAPSTSEYYPALVDKMGQPLSTALNGASSPEEAASWFDDQFERSGDRYCEESKTCSVGPNFKGYSNRKGNAKAIYEIIKNGFTATAFISMPDSVLSFSTFLSLGLSKALGLGNSGAVQALRVSNKYDSTKLKGRSVAENDKEKLAIKVQSRVGNVWGGTLEEFDATASLNWINANGPELICTWYRYQYHVMNQKKYLGIKLEKLTSGDPSCNVAAPLEKVKGLNKYRPDRWDWPRGINPVYLQELRSALEAYIANEAAAAAGEQPGGGDEPQPSTSNPPADNSSGGAGESASETSTETEEDKGSGLPCEELTPGGYSNGSGYFVHVGDIPIDPNGWALPMANFNVTDYFGTRNGSHMGMDISSWNPTEPIVTVRGGAVVYTYDGCKYRGSMADYCGEPPYGGYGNVVVVDHGDGYSTLYAHLSSVKVKAGEKIDRLTVVGLQGSSGNSSGDHLHFELKKEGRQINPESVMRIPTTARQSA